MNDFKLYAALISSVALLSACEQSKPEPRYMLVLDMASIMQENMTEQECYNETTRILLEGSDTRVWSCHTEKDRAFIEKVGRIESQFGGPLSEREKRALLERRRKESEKPEIIFQPPPVGERERQRDDGRGVDSIKSAFDIDREYRQDMETCGDYPMTDDRFMEGYNCRESVKVRYSIEYPEQTFPDKIN